MEKYTLPRGRGGWQESEKELLFSLVEDAAKNGTPLRNVFDDVAAKTGRKPNSIRNYYYISMKQGDAPSCVCPKAAPFRPFEEEELHELISYVLIGRLKGKSVRACVLELGEGDRTKTLRYQNKYRSVIKNRPEYVDSVKKELTQSGYDFPETFTPVRKKRQNSDRIFIESETLKKAYEKGKEDFLSALTELLLNIKEETDGI